MKSLFRKLQIDATDKQIRNYFEKVDMDHNGEISFDEFVNEILPNFIRNDD
jgi:Ca2+-binding EF-hand superfamily protein